VKAKKKFTLTSERVDDTHSQRPYSPQ